METDRVTRIDSRSMAAILLDIDGVFHVSGRPIDGAGEAIRRLRDDGHRLRFVTNSTTRSRADLADDLRAFGVELEDEELETTPRAAARTLAGKRVLALTMAAIRTSSKASSSSARKRTRSCSAAQTRPTRRTASSAT